MLRQPVILEHVQQVGFSGTVVQPQEEQFP